MNAERIRDEGWKKILKAVEESAEMKPRMDITDAILHTVKVAFETGFDLGFVAGETNVSVRTSDTKSNH